MKSYDIFNLKMRVSEVLFYIWDPLGVNELPGCRGEYEHYVPEILKLVEESDDIKPISHRLSRIAGAKMGTYSDRAKCDLTAGLLLQHKKEIKSGKT